MENAIRKARTDLRKIYPKKALETDCISRWGRRYLCYVKNVRGIKSFVKNQMNRRMRRISKDLVQKSWIEIREAEYDFEEDIYPGCPCIACQRQRMNDYEISDHQTSVYLELMKLRSQGKMSIEVFNSMREMIFSNDSGDTDFAMAIIDSMNTGEVDIN